MAPSRRVRIAPLAEQDIKNILTWTRRKFGAAQARACYGTLNRAIHELVEEPLPIAAGCERILCRAPALHGARKGRQGRHLLAYRVTNDVIDVGRVLHDRMDLPRHFEPDE